MLIPERQHYLKYSDGFNSPKYTIQLSLPEWKKFAEMGFLFEEYYALATRKNDSITRVHTIWYFNFNSPESQADSAPPLLFADFLERAGRLPNYIWISRYFSLSRCSSINNIIFADPPLSPLSLDSRHIFTWKLISVLLFKNTHIVKHTVHSNKTQSFHLETQLLPIWGYQGS